MATHFIQRKNSADGEEEFDAARPDMTPPAVQRTEFGLIATLAAARDLRQVLGPDDPAHVPLACASVWSLGDRAPNWSG